MLKEPDRSLEYIVGNPDFNALQELLDKIKSLYNEYSEEKILLNLKLIVQKYSAGIIMHKMYESQDSFDDLLEQIKGIYTENHENKIRLALSACIKDIELDEQVRKDKEAGENRTVERGEIYYCELTGVVGSEASGKRPVLIISNNENNKHSSKVNAILLTTKPKNLVFAEGINKTDLKSGYVKDKTKAVVTDILSIEKARLDNRIAVVKDEKMDLIAQKVRNQLGI